MSTCDTDGDRTFDHCCHCFRY
ncbi:hypothetical protein CY0110_19077 [Crocosphaera chwakensis CCY0110]|uniref:Uncharacterized protein n=1 Tax=Crocosphaera chwakensis CCY0110 TaxID=391612 RepID=A3IJE7_9CHRO|nr:hypothetical protein CY0110_19077 [Crocosphaera chwakensis CCY0110]